MTKGYKEILGEVFLHFNHGVGFTVVHICPAIKSYTLNMWVYCLSIIHQQS